MNTLLAAVLLPIACASCVSVSVIPRFGPLDVDGQIGINDSTSGLSSRNDFDAIGVEEDDGVVGGRVDLELGGMHTTFQLSDSSHDGSGTLQAEFSDGTTTIPAGTDIDSDLDLMIGEAMVTWDLVPGDTVEIGIGLGATIFGVDSTFAAPSTGDSIETDEVVPMPLLVARAGVALGDIDLSAVFGGMQIDLDGREGTFYDLDVMARWKLVGEKGVFVGALVVGYRYVDLAADYEDSGARIDADARISGPYLGLNFGF